MKRVIGVCLILFISLFSFSGCMQLQGIPSTEKTAVDTGSSSESLAGKEDETSRSNASAGVDEASAGPEEATKEGPPKTYHFLHVSDLHGILVNGEEEPVLSDLAYALSYQVSLNPERTIVMSGGDNIDAGQSQEQTLRRKEIHHLYLQALSRIGIQISAIGNHELQAFGVGGVGDAFAGLDMKLVCANLVDNEKQPIFDPYHIFVLGDLRVAVIGSSSDKVKQRGMVDGEADVYYLEHAVAVERAVGEITDGGLADVILLLIHEGGYNIDEQQSGPLFELVAELKGVDAVFGGDSHSLVSARVGGVPVVIPGAYGLGFQEVELTREPGKADGYRIRFHRVERRGDESVGQLHPEVEGMMKEMNMVD